ncbi:MAG: LacI family transcriptional regulator, partial [Candidatus Caldatribacteriaceae bacterium]
MKRIPIFLLDREIENWKDVDIDIVKGDSIYGAFVLTLNLIKLGHTNIGIVVGNRDTSTAEDRVKGHQKALEESKMPLKNRKCP